MLIFVAFFCILYCVPIKSNYQTHGNMLTMFWVRSRRPFCESAAYLLDSRVPTVRECQGKQRGSGKSQGILKYCSLDQLFMHYFHNFCRLLGALPPDPQRGSALLVYIAIFYNGTKFSITFV